jgi:hypothetical protein
MNWDDITIGKLQAIQEIDDTFNPIERVAHIVAIIKGIPYSEVEKWTLNELRAIDLSFLDEIPKSKFAFSFKHKKRYFKLVSNAKEMKAHHFIELQEVTKGNIIENLHTIIALLSYRVNFWGKRIEDDYEWKVENFKDLKAIDFNNYALFFSAVYPKLLDATLSFLGEKREEMEELLDGYRLSTDSQVADEPSGT